jgi:lantibiotic modifying enzyme
MSPAVPDAVAETARSGAAPVFRYVARSAEVVAEGVRWQTLDAAYRPQYRGDFYASGGIPLFLADYYRLTRDERALILGMGGARWCDAPGRRFLGDRRGTEDWGLLLGRSGLGLTWLRLAAVSGDATALERAVTIATRLLEREPAGNPHLGSGVAGQGLFLLGLWERTRDEGHLAGAIRCGEWLAAQAVWQDAGCSWPPAHDPGRPDRTAMVAGIAGTGMFLVKLYRATGEARWAALARGGATTLSREARADRGGLNWLPLVGADFDCDADWQRIPVRAPLTRCQWCNGAPGVGLFFVTAYEILGEAAYLATAEGAGEATFAYGDGRANPSYCHGLAGNAELFIELYRVGGAPRWGARAHDFARRMLAYRTTGAAGDTWPADEPGTAAPDFLCGAAGVGHAFLRLLAPSVVPPALF